MIKFWRFIVALYRSDQQIDFPRLWNKTRIASLVVLVLSGAGFAVRGLDLGIDFSGGTSWEVQAAGVSVSETRSALQETEVGSAKIQTVGADTIRVRADTNDAENVSLVRTALAELANVELEQVSVTTVGPSWGSQVTAKARNALLVFFALVAAYIAIRLEWKMAIGALAAVIHDIIVCVGFYSLFQLEITPATIIAFLTIMGYSLYDTIVVYDKVHEVVGKISSDRRHTYTEMMNISLNRVLMRSVNTSITSMMPILSMLVIGSALFGASTLEEFSVALLLGVVVGTYSSLFVAAPLVSWLKEREPENIALAQKSQFRQAGSRKADTGDRGRSGRIEAGRGSTRLRKKVLGGSSDTSRDDSRIEESDDTLEFSGSEAPQATQKPGFDRTSRQTESTSGPHRSLPTASSVPIIKPKPRKKRRKK
ncbi:MAG: protein translocase subunit SecF [Acidimicrobiaceae bacterium]|nr:protein translocase subunit SecF [Acidimicrobiaceae bacterium]